MQPRPFTVLLVTLLLAAPVAAAWGAKGSFEPSTARDANERWMFTTPSTSGERVYFNGWQGHTTGSLNPNVATLQSSIAGQDYVFYAMLGAWRDCNRDGFVGWGDQGLFEYRAELLTDASVCPRQSTPSPIPFDWKATHNDGQWVREWISLAWHDYNDLNFGLPHDNNPFDFNDNGSRVWFDYGEPDRVEIPNFNCWIGVSPRGTMHSTGGMLSYADCYAGYHVTDDLDVVLDGVGLHEYSFDDHPRDPWNSSSPLNQRNPWGDARDDSAVTAFDCGNTLVAARDPTAPPGGHGALYGIQPPAGNPINVSRSDGYLAYYNVSHPRSNPSVNPDGSAAGTINQTQTDVDDCDRSHTSSGTAEIAYFYEGDVAQPLVKQAATGVMTPQSSTRPNAPYALLGAATPPDATDLGAGLRRSDGFWQDSVRHFNEGPLVDNAGLAPNKVMHVTYYAFVSRDAVTKLGLLLPNGAVTGAYGGETCGTHTTGEWNGWDCDASHWYRGNDGADIQPTTGRLAQQRTPIGPFPGSLYNVRDVDCIDMSVGAARDVGVGYGLLTQTACDPFP